jgi:hypothetical protein
MKTQLLFAFLFVSETCSKGSIGVVRAAEAATMPIPRSSVAAPSASRPVTWSPKVAGPQRSELDRALDKPLALPWKMIDQKTKERRDATTCRDLLALNATSEPVDVSDDGSPPTPLFEDDWSTYANDLVACRLVVAIQNAKPSRVDYLGPFTLDDARLNEIPAAVVPTP